MVCQKQTSANESDSSIYVRIRQQSSAVGKKCVANRRPAAAEAERIGSGELGVCDSACTCSSAHQAGPEAQMGIMREEIAVMHNAPFATRY